MNSLKIGNRIIDDNSDPYIIAEIGVNHECSISKAKQLILKAKIKTADFFVTDPDEYQNEIAIPISFL